MRGQGLTIDASVDTLLRTLATNRDKHLKAYEKAKRGWIKLLQRDLAQLQKDLGAGESIEKTRLYLKQKPEHYLSEYDEAMEMLHYATNPTIELDQEQFRAYVKDEWTWTNTWHSATSSYLAAGR